MKILILICGVYSLGFAIFHIGFWKIFRWKSDLSKLRFENRGILQILNIQLIFYFFFVAFICFYFSTKLLDSNIGKLFLLSNSLFWLLRTIQQFIFLKANHYAIHTLTVIFVIGTILFALPLFL